MIQTLKHIIITFFIAFVIAFIVGYVVARKQLAPPEVTAQTLLVSMQNEGFLVTQELILEEDITIDNRSGNALKDFFVSETVSAEAKLRIAVGIDASSLSAEDVRIDGKVIQLTLPSPSIFSTEIVGDVTIDTERGIISKITSGEEDYNGLVATLKEQARASLADDDLTAAIELGSIQSIERFFGAVAPSYSVAVQYE